MSTGWRHVLVTVLILVVGVSAIGAAGVASQQNGDVTKIHTCHRITEPGTYVLTDDIRNGGGSGGFAYISETCITIAASDVVLDGQGHTVDGFGISDTTGIGIDENAEVNDVRVKNVYLTDWNRGVYLGDVDGATVQNVNSSGNSYGFFVENTRETTIRDSTANGNFIGIYHQNARGNTFRTNTYRDNHIDGVVWGKEEERRAGNASESGTVTRNASDA